jgi:hypothetical protein
VSYEINQLFVADSFQAMYLDKAGRSTLSREALHARHELCEDLAQSLSEVCLDLQSRNDIGLPAAIEQCHAGLVGSDSGVSQAEAGWVTHRIAELLQQGAPEFLRQPSE